MLLIFYHTVVSTVVLELSYVMLYYVYRHMLYHIISYFIILYYILLIYYVVCYVLSTHMSFPGCAWCICCICLSFPKDSPAPTARLKPRALIRRQEPVKLSGKSYPWLSFTGQISSSRIHKLHVSS